MKDFIFKIILKAMFKRLNIRMSYKPANEEVVIRFNLGLDSYTKLKKEYNKLFNESVKVKEKVNKLG